MLSWIVILPVPSLLPAGTTAPVTDLLDKGSTLYLLEAAAWLEEFIPVKLVMGALPWIITP
jgi:hypothetical protein